MSYHHNVTLALPSGARAVRQTDAGRYVLPASCAVLTFADVEALYADSISGDGHGNTPAPESHGERRR